MLGEWSVAIAVFVSPIGKPIVSLQAHSQMFPFPSVFMPFCCACWEKLEQKIWKMVLNLGFIFDQMCSAHIFSSHSTFPHYIPIATATLSAGTPPVTQPHLQTFITVSLFSHSLLRRTSPVAPLFCYYR
ncbi:unnamed protein product [Citrullus colocynthis]|uniref:Uncharacterized protein n=1 Tax=Citrullus colocynthis TaxID=252529 RepID=A0ABP0YQC4_9ROSI